MKTKSIYIIIDALRYDLLMDSEVRKNLFPALDMAIKNGFLTKAIANGQSTQFVLPSLFSSTYPLDHGGYNFGIRDRNSYIQDVKKKKISTYLMSTCNQMGIGNGYDKGFDQVYTTNDYRLIIEQKINRTILYELKLYKLKKKSKLEIIKYIQKEFGITLDRIISYKNVNQQLWPNNLKTINRQIINNSLKEKNLLLEKPEAVLNKMLKVSGGTYWHTLGKENYNCLSYQIERVIVAFNWRFKRIVEKQNFWPFYKLGHYAVVINDIIDDLIKRILSINKKSWHIHIHLMDVHDHRALNNPFILFKRLRFFPKWFIQRVKGNIMHKFLYVSAVMDLDKNLEKLFQELKKNNLFDDILFLITADHASYYPESPRKKLNVAYRTHYEDLDIPLIMSNISSKPKKGIMCDSMDITATFVSALGITPSSFYKGENIFLSNKNFVVSESCGSGNADIKRKDVYFTVSTKKFKMMATLSDQGLKIRKLFNKEKDPYELTDISQNKVYKRDVKNLVKILYQKRNEIFKIKGIKKDPFA